MEPCGFFIQSGPDRATQTGLIMLIYSNGIVITWQAACCAVCQPSDRPVITGTQHSHHRHFNNLTNESPARMTAAAVLTSEEKQLVIWWWGFYIECATFPPSLQRPLTSNEEKRHVHMLRWVSGWAQQSKHGRKQKREERRKMGNV